jgi:hypothetical protein
MIEIPQTQKKVREAEFFLDLLRTEETRYSPNAEVLGANGEVFDYYLSAFLGAAKSVSYVLEREAKTALKSASDSSGKQAKAHYTDWQSKWEGDLSPEDAAYWKLLHVLRVDEVHGPGVKTLKQVKAVPYRPDLALEAYGYGFRAAAALGLSSSSEGGPWHGAKIHHVEIEGQRHEVAVVCARFLQLVERFVVDFNQSALVAPSA